MKKITDIMYTGENISVADKNTGVRELLEIMDNKKLGAVCITEDEKLIGIVTDGDLRRIILSTQDTLPILFMKRAEKLMHTSPKFIYKDASLHECLQTLMQYRFWVIPVVDRDIRLIGIVHMHDLIKEFINKDG